MNKSGFIVHYHSLRGGPKNGGTLLYRLASNFV